MTEAWLSVPEGVQAQREVDLGGFSYVFIIPCCAELHNGSLVGAIQSIRSQAEMTREKCAVVLAINNPDPSQAQYTGMYAENKAMIQVLAAAQNHAPVGDPALDPWVAKYRALMTGSDLALFWLDLTDHPLCHGNMGRVRDFAARFACASLAKAQRLSHPWLVMLDADSWLGERYLNVLKDLAAANPRLNAVAATLMYVPEEDPLMLARFYEDDLNRFHYTRLFHIGIHYFDCRPYAPGCPGPALAVRADALARVGGYPHIAYSEDREVMFRLAADGPVLGPTAGHMVFTLDRVRDIGGDSRGRYLDVHFNRKRSFNNFPVGPLACAIAHRRFQIESGSAPSIDMVRSWVTEFSEMPECRWEHLAELALTEQDFGKLVRGYAVLFSKSGARKYDAFDQAISQILSFLPRCLPPEVLKQHLPLTEGRMRAVFGAEPPGLTAAQKKYRAWLIQAQSLYYACARWYWERQGFRLSGAEAADDLGIEKR